VGNGGCNGDLVYTNYMTSYVNLIMKIDATLTTHLQLTTTSMFPDTFNLKSLIP